MNGKSSHSPDPLRVIHIDRPLAYPPRVTDFTQRFWNALAEGRLETTCCDACGHMTFPPKPFCPNCWSKTVIWKAIDPAGTLYSWTRIHAGPAVFAAELPYCVGVLDLDCGIRVACRLWCDNENEAWACGDRARMIVISATNGVNFAASAHD